MAPRGLDPLRLTSAFWTRDDVIQALRDRDVGILFRLIQKHTGASHTKIANAVGMTHSMISAFINQKRHVTALDVYERIADGLEMPDAARLVLGLAAIDAPTALPATPAPTKVTEGPPTVLAHLINKFNQTYPEAARDLRISERHLGRIARGERNTTTLNASTRRALEREYQLPVEELLRPYSGADPSPAPEAKALPDKRRTVEVDAHPLRLPGTANADLDPEEEAVRRRHLLEDFAIVGAAAPFLGLETIRHRLHNILGDSPHDLAEWEAIAWDYACTYATTPPLSLMQDLTTDLLVAETQLRRLDRDSSPWKDMCRVLASLAVVAAHTMANLASFRASRRWWRTARTYSDRSSDNQLRTWVYGREVIGALYEQRPLDQVLALADAASVIAGTPGIGTGTVLIGRAQVLSSLGRAHDARQAMKDVYAAADRLPAQVTNDFDSLYGWSEHRLRHGESFVYTNIGATKDSAIAQERALVLYPHHMVRERAQIQLHQAVRLIHEGDSAAGATHAVRVLSNLHATQRTEVVIEVARSVIRAIPTSEHNRSEVAALRECVAAPDSSLQTR